MWMIEERVENLLGVGLVGRVAIEVDAQDAEPSPDIHARGVDADHDGPVFGGSAAGAGERGEMVLAGVGALAERRLGAAQRVWRDHERGVEDLVVDARGFNAEQDPAPLARRSVVDEVAIGGFVGVRIDVGGRAEHLEGSVAVIGDAEDQRLGFVIRRCFRTVGRERNNGASRGGVEDVGEPQGAIADEQDTRIAGAQDAGRSLGVERERA